MARHILGVVFAVCAVTRFVVTASVGASELSSKVRIQFVEECMMAEWYPEEALAQLILRRPVGEHVDEVTVDGKKISLMPHGEDTFVDLWLDTVPAVCRVGSHLGGSAKFVARPGYCYVCLVTGQDAVADNSVVPAVPNSQEPIHVAPHDIGGNDEQIRWSIGEEQQHFNDLKGQADVLHGEIVGLEVAIAKIKTERQILAQDKASLLAVRDNLLTLNSDGIVDPVSAVRDATETQLKSVIAALRSNARKLAPLQPQLNRKNHQFETLEQQLTKSLAVLEALKEAGMSASESDAR